MSAERQDNGRQRHGLHGRFGKGCGHCPGERPRCRSSPEFHHFLQRHRTRRDADGGPSEGCPIPAAAEAHTPRLSSRAQGGLEYAYRRQVEEYERLYGGPPSRIDGHHHMHLCADMLIDRVIPAGIRVRRNLSFFEGSEASSPERTARLSIPGCQKVQVHRLCLSPPPIAMERGMKRIADIAPLRGRIGGAPGVGAARRFLMGHEYPDCIAGVARGRGQVHGGERGMTTCRMRGRSARKRRVRIAGACAGGIRGTRVNE